MDYSLVVVQWLSVGLFSHNLTGQLHQLFSQVIVPRKLAAWLWIRGRADIFARFVGHRCSISHGQRVSNEIGQSLRIRYSQSRERSLKLRFLECRHQDAHPIASKWIWLMNVVSTHVRIDDARMSCIDQDPWMLLGQMPCKIPAIQDGRQF